MFAMPILDVAIGLSFFYLLLGLICSTVNEMIAARLKIRARMLDQGIGRLLGGDDALKAELYKHPMIASMVQDARAICPSYIPAARFSKALLDIISGDAPLTSVAALREGAKKIANPELQKALQTLIDAAHDDPAQVRKNVEDWFDQNMDRVSGWYKRNAQFNATLLAIAITLVMNADTVKISRLLWNNPAMRAAVVEQARVRAAQKPPEESLPLVEYTNPNDATASTPINVPTSPEAALSPAEQDLLGQLTGWEADWGAFGKAPNWWTWLGQLLFAHLIGWIFTAVAVSLGAPFWFDTLNRFMNIRNAGRAPDEARTKNA